jgi:hypothetical protein
MEARLGKGDWVEYFEPPNLYLNLNSIDREKFRQPDVEALAGKMAHSIPGVGEVYTAAQFFLNEVPNGICLLHPARWNWHRLSLFV